MILIRCGEGETGDSAFDGFWEMFNDGRRMVGAGADVERFTVRFSVGFVGSVPFLKTSDTSRKSFKVGFDTVVTGFVTT